ncbi:MAG: replication-associated recombination protein A [Bryobacterales bacterium]|nr:replication-associated recombination protein A [Bryobacterales bacterium]
MSLFASGLPGDAQNEAGLRRPLAERMRPRTLEEYAGQKHLLAEGKPLRRQIEADRIGSLILWGPPGVGKTTIARLIATCTKADFVPFSAVLSGIKEVKTVMEEAERNRKLGRRTVLFIDEIHRFNKAQQDAFLPYVERGDITLIGATTENPSFEVNSALLSRSRVYRLEALSEEDLIGLLERALGDPERGLNGSVSVPEEFLRMIASQSNGDARAAYNILETLAAAVDGDTVTEETVRGVLQKRTLYYDKQGEEHFNIISALHKSVRSSQVDAAIYWLTRMLEAGEDRMYLARRLVRMAIEDIGLADPRAMEQAIAAMQTVHFLGVPEGDQALVQLTIYLALAQKSDAGYQAAKAATAAVRASAPEPVPMHLRNAPTKAMKAWGYGAEYQHAHANPDGLSAMECLPEALAETRFYTPTGRGLEARISERLREIEAWRQSQKREDGSIKKSGGAAEV